MAKVLLGFLLGLAVTTFAVEKHSDGSVTFAREEIEQITINWVNMDYAVRVQAERIRTLQKELDELAANKCI